MYTNQLLIKTYEVFKLCKSVAGHKFLHHVIARNEAISSMLINYDKSQSNNESYKSFHSGFIELTNCCLCLRLLPFNAFSAAMASSICG
jgi:hypothetical protein